MYRVGLVSLGCSKNRVDSEVMLGILAKQGYKVTSESSEADIIIINTCCFIGSAKEESINVILEHLQYKKTGNCKALIVAGCLGERYQEELKQEIPEIDAIVGPGNYTNIDFILNEVIAGKYITLCGNLDFRLKDPEPRIISTNKPTAYLKIAEGCDNFCTYCVIPSLRGRFKSRSIDSLLLEANDLAINNGIQELIIVAQDITRYGQDLDDGSNLIILLKELCKIDSLKWIRLLYSYPDRIDDELINYIASEEKICKYLDMPIQHINNTMLKKMNRATNSNHIRNLIEKFRGRIPDIILRTSLIVGFPGEGEKEFDELLDFVKEGHFNHIGVFPYSREEGTKAAEFEDQIEESVKNERYSKVMSAQSRVSKKLNRERIGHTNDVLIEGRESENMYFGRSFAEVPEIDGLVYVYSVDKLEIGTFVKTKITNAYEYDLLGEAYESCK